MKRLVQAQRTTQKLIACLRTDQYKDDQQIAELEQEIKVLEPIFNNMISEFEHSPQLTKQIIEMCRIWEVVRKLQVMVRKLSDNLRENMSTMSTVNVKSNVVNEANKTDQKYIIKLQQEVQRALRMVDTAHTREQVAHEAVENLRQQVSRLHQDIELKRRMAEQEGMYSLLTKNKETLIKEGERMAAEIIALKEKLQSSIAYQEDLERKNSNTDLRVAQLIREIETRKNQVSKDSKSKEQYEDEILELKNELATKEQEIIQLNTQLLENQNTTSELINNNKDQVAVIEKLNQNIEAQHQRILKLMEDVQRETAAVEDCNQQIVVLNTQYKLKEDYTAKMLLEAEKVMEEQESLKIKLNKIEVEKCQAIEKSKKLEMDMISLRRVGDDNKRLLTLEKRKMEGLAREKDIINRNAMRTTVMLNEQMREARIREQARLHLEHEIDNNRFDISKQSQDLYIMEKERDRYIGETVVLTKKVEAAMEDVKLKQASLYEHKKKLAQTETKLTTKCNQLESMRYELNTCSRNLVESQDDAIDLSKKNKMMTLQIEQLKDDIAGKETQLIREQLALRKAHGEKEEMRLEVLKSKSDLKDCKNEMCTLRKEMLALHSIIRQADNEKDRENKDKMKFLNEKDIIGSQLVRRNDEVTLLRNKLKVFQSTIDKEQLQYTQRLQDIQFLKLEVKKLSEEKTLLTKSLDKMMDLRSEVHNLEKSLMEERLKAKAMEDELKNPMNMHQWRKLPQSEPNIFKMVQKVARQRQRLVEQDEAMLELQDVHSKLEREFVALEEKEPPLDEIVALQKQMKEKDTKIKGLSAELNMREAQVADYRAKVDRLKQELADMKKILYEQKQKAEKLGQKLEVNKVQKPEITVSGSTLDSDSVSRELPPLPQKPRFLGGGFNMGLSAN